MWRIKVIAIIIVLWSPMVWGATLQWTANTELDLAGYRIYHRSQQPCGRAQGTATLLTTVGKVTSFNIGTPTVAQYYVLTAFDTAGLESNDSKVVAYIPPTPPPPSQPASAAPPAPTGLHVLQLF